MSTADLISSGVPASFFERPQPQPDRHRKVPRHNPPITYEEYGYLDGISNLQWTACRLRTSEDVFAWYRGWRRGQAERGRAAA
jgi:hypothetical protein